MLLAVVRCGAVLVESSEVSMKRSSLTRRTPMKRAGKKTLAWETTRRKLKVRFERAGITRCEWPEGCGREWPLSFSHTKPRRDITTQAELEAVALLCTFHHHAADCHGHEHQFKTITAIIANRETPVI